MINSLRGYSLRPATLHPITGYAGLIPTSTPSTNPLVAQGIASSFIKINDFPILDARTLHEFYERHRLPKWWSGRINRFDHTIGCEPSRGTFLVSKHTLDQLLDLTNTNQPAITVKFSSGNKTVELKNLYLEKYMQAIPTASLTTATPMLVTFVDKRFLLQYSSVIKTTPPQSSPETLLRNIQTQTFNGITISSFSSHSDVTGTFQSLVPKLSLLGLNGYEVFKTLCELLGYTITTDLTTYGNGLKVVSLCNHEQTDRNTITNQLPTAVYTYDGMHRMKVPEKIQCIFQNSNHHFNYKNRYGNIQTKLPYGNIDKRHIPHQNLTQYEDIYYEEVINTSGTVDSSHIIPNTQMSVHIPFSTIWNNVYPDTIDNTSELSAFAEYIASIQSLRLVEQNYHQKIYNYPFTISLSSFIHRITWKDEGQGLVTEISANPLSTNPLDSAGYTPGYKGPFLVKTTTEHVLDATEEVTIYDGNSGSSLDYQVEAINRFVDLADDKWAISVDIDGKQHLIAGECS